MYYKCFVVRERECLDDESILRFLSGRVDTRERASVERHADACPDCAVLLVPSGAYPVPRRGREARAFASGDLVAGRYRIERLIGRGGMGEVYSALDEQLGELVALKTVRATIADDARAIARLKSEVLLARRVTHPNVCRIFDLGVHAEAASPDRPLAFLTMELLTGRTLADEIRAQGPFAEGAARRVLGQLVAGLAAAHRAGVVHKDLKSENVILVKAVGGDDTSSGFARAVITDFGLAASEQRPLQSAAGRVEFSGTPGYIAPERLRGAAATPGSDVYSLGVVLLDMLAGRVPARPPAAEAPRSSLSGLDLRGIAACCCDARPEARPSADALAAVLAKIQQPASRLAVRAGFAAGAAVLVTTAALMARSARAPSVAPAPGSSGRPAVEAERTVVDDHPAPPPVVAPAPLPSAGSAGPVRRRTRANVRNQPRSAVALDESERPQESRRVTGGAGAGDPEAETARHQDEPIRSLGAVERKEQPGTVTLRGDDDAIDPFEAPR
jgi:hypothetical protein